MVSAGDRRDVVVAQLLHPSRLCAPASLTAAANAAINSAAAGHISPPKVQLQILPVMRCHNRGFKLVIVAAQL